MSENPDLKLAELLTARLCHDLAGAAAGISAGAELLEEESAGSGIAAESIKLLGDSARRVNVRLKFMRAAFGREGGGGSLSGWDGVRDLLAEYLSEGGGSAALRLDWRIAGAAPAAPGEMRLVLILAMLAAEALPKGGVIQAETAAGRARILGQGPMIRLDESLGAALQNINPPAELTPKLAPGLVAGSLARRAGMRIGLETGADRFVFALGSAG